ncbi:hypothetical protein QAD02_011537 [Eretmocerus hayati]|uniref:Uncharacterized protein n=1 Tax=Eretmocerus hayati TaxID=131215 RepID=A0ACC2NY72_9HYME|nr:hypothetical protein QAD02_011537 [Eretmocerus hayati]
MASAQTSILVLCFVSLAPTLDSTESISKYIYVEDDARLVSFSMYETTLTYVSCQGPDKSWIVCNLTIAQRDTGYQPKIRNNFLQEVVHSTSEWKTKVFLFHNNDVVVVWGYHDKLNHFTSLKLFFVRKFSQAIKISKIHLNNHFMNVTGMVDHLFILRTSTGFEAIYEDDCSDLCSVGFDNDGTQVTRSKNTNYLISKQGYFVYPTETHLNISNGNHCFLMWSEERLNASLFFGTNAQQMFKTVKNLGFYSPDLKISTANRDLSICEQNPSDKTILTCTRGNSRSWLYLEFPYEFQNSIVYNLPRGEFLTITNRVMKPSEGDVIFQFFLTAFNAHGQHMYSEQITHYSCPEVNPVNLYVHIYEGSVDNYCVSLAKLTRIPHFVAKCLPKVLISQ